LAEPFFAGAFFAEDFFAAPFAEPFFTPADFLLADFAAPFFAADRVPALFADDFVVPFFVACFLAGILILLTDIVRAMATDRAQKSHKMF
jgi:hypothetical protein